MNKQSPLPGAEIATPAWNAGSVHEALSRAMLRDGHRLRRRLEDLRRRGESVASAASQDLILELQISIERAESRAAALPDIQIPDELPIAAKAAEIAQVLAQSQVLIVCGDTGSGKSTQLPKICLSAGRGVRGLIGHTQPRRLAARTLASRIAQELNSDLGRLVGYKVRFNDRVGPDAYIKLMTDGILLAEIPKDRWLNAYDTLIIDEAHERSLNIDFILGYLKTLLPRRPDLKLIITSATIDPARFAQHFGGAPVVEVSGRGYPVELRYQPLAAESEGEEDLSLAEGLVKAVDEVSRIDRGDILVFLPGEREIRDCTEALRKHRLPDTDVLPLYARLSAAEQNRIFAGHQRRHIVLATNVAETSLTVPGVRYVIDSGLARISRYSPRSKVLRLPIEPISQSSADQRKGRCGRVAAGICLRLYAEADFLNRPQYTDPEIRRASLAAVILRLKHLRLGAVEQFPFIDPPEQRYITDGYKLLEELGAISTAKELTEIGIRLARLNVDPRVGRMLLAGVDEACLSEMLIIGSALSVQDPRERPSDKEAKADAAHAQFKEEGSDFLWYLNLWRDYHEQQRHLSQAKLRKHCQALFLSYMRMREWMDIHAQLTALIHDMGFHTNAEPAERDNIHRALLAGLLGNVAKKTEKGDYQGVRGNKLAIFPGSGLFKSRPPWIMAAELADTARVYARTVAQIDPQWILKVGKHLLHRHYDDPHWERRRARAVVYEKLTLYGLTIVDRRRADYARIDPVGARRIFIQSALVEGDYDTKAPYAAHNQQLIREVQDLEHRARRLDLLADEQQRFDFFDQRLPAQVLSGESFERWRREAEREDPRILMFTPGLLLRPEAALVSKTDFPDALDIEGMQIPLSYRFDPGHEADGVTAHIPLMALQILRPEMFDDLVSGLFHEKVTSLIRSLAKPLRRQLVPAPDVARFWLSQLRQSSGALSSRLSTAARQTANVEIAAEDWRADLLPDYLRMNYRVLDANRVVLGEGRDLAYLQRRLGAQVRNLFQASSWTIERTGIKRWDFGDLPEVVERQEHGITLRGYPALIDTRDSVAIRVFPNAAEAQAAHRLGLHRLFLLELPQQAQYLRKNLRHFQSMSLAYAAVGNADDLRQDLLRAVLDRSFLANGVEIRTQEDFARAREQGRAVMMEHANAVCDLVWEILSAYQAIRRDLGAALPAACLEAAADMRDQHNYMIYKGFIGNTPADRLSQLPRYLKAIALRLTKITRDPLKDRQKAAPILPFWQACKQLIDAQDSRCGTLEFAAFRWMIEEFRVSQFAQELGTAIPVSESRLKQQLDRVHQPNVRP
jgi:ATP-dependent helicase HrpA